MSLSSITTSRALASSCCCCWLPLSLLSLPLLLFLLLLLPCFSPQSISYGFESIQKQTCSTSFFLLSSPPPPPLCTPAARSAVSCLNSPHVLLPLLQLHVWTHVQHILLLLHLLLHSDGGDLILQVVFFFFSFSEKLTKDSNLPIHE